MMSLESFHSHAKADTVNLENMAKVYNRIRQIYLQRNSLLDRVRIITRKMREQSADISSMFDEDEMNSSFYEMLECSFNEQQIDADLRVKVVRQRQCIEQLSTELDVCRDELLQSREKLDELKKENESLGRFSSLRKDLATGNNNWIVSLMIWILTLRDFSPGTCMQRNCKEARIIRTISFPQ